MIWCKRLILVIWFALLHPLQIISLPLPAIATNWRLRKIRRQGAKVLLLYIDHAGYLPFIVTVWEQLAGRSSDLQIFVVARSHAIAEIKKAVANLDPSPRGYFPSWVGALIVEYDLFITTHQSSIAPVFGWSPRVCSFHGLPAKGGTFVESQWRFLDGAFLIGPLQKSIFDDFRRSSATGRRLWYREIGYPKSDALVNGDYLRASTLGKLGLDPHLPTVVYAPSWEEHTSLRTCGSAIVDALCSMNMNVVIKLHPMSYYPVSEMNATGGVDWRAELKRFEFRPHFRHIDGGDVAPLVAAADVLVTDVSSVAFEAILCDCPVVFFDVPRFFDEVVSTMYDISPREAREQLRYNCGREAGIVVASTDELKDAVRRSLNHPTELQPARTHVRVQLLYNAGHASEAAADAILELLGISNQATSTHVAAGD